MSSKKRWINLCGFFNVVYCVAGNLRERSRNRRIELDAAAFFDNREGFFYGGWNRGRMFYLYRGGARYRIDTGVVRRKGRPGTQDKWRTNGRGWINVFDSFYIRRRVIVRLIWQQTGLQYKTEGVVRDGGAPGRAAEELSADVLPRERGDSGVVGSD